jgi:ribonucleoside-diphosphate reductase alpha chain
MTDTVNGRGTTGASTSAGQRGGKTDGARKGLTIERVHTTPGVHPYDEVIWERRDVVMTN